jgi:phage-related protein
LTAWTLVQWDSTVYDLLAELDMKGQVRVTRDLKKLKAEGNRLHGPFIDSFGDGLYELRTQYNGMIFRHLFCYHPNRRGWIVVLHSFQKKGQKTSDGDKDIGYGRLAKIKSQEVRLVSVELH